MLSLRSRCRGNRASAFGWVALAAVFVACGSDDDVRSASGAPGGNQGAAATGGSAGTASPNDVEVDSGIPDGSTGAGGTVGSGNPDVQAPDATGTGPDAEVDGGLDGGGADGGDAADSAPPMSVRCGDGIRGLNEECDDGNLDDPDAVPGSGDSCSDSCKVRDVLVVATSAPDASGGRGRRLGAGAHPVAAGERGFAVALLDEAALPARVALQAFDAVGVRRGALLTLDDRAPVLSANPVAAALPGGAYAVAWSDLASAQNSGDGDGLGIALARIDAEATGPRTVVHANANGPGAPDRTTSVQRDADVLWSGSELVVAWVDEANPSTAPDLRFRRFTSELDAKSDVGDLAATAAGEFGVVLATSSEGWSAAWRSTAGSAETLRVSSVSASGSELRSWSVGPFTAAPAEERPALAQIAPGLLLAVFAVSTDPDQSGRFGTARLRAALLDRAASEPSPSFAIDPLDPDYAGDASIAQTRPSVVVANGRIFVAWRSSRIPGDPAGEVVWLKELTWQPASATLDLAKPELVLPREPSHSVGDQRSPALVAADFLQAGAIVAVWDDYGRTFGDLEQRPDVVGQLIPVPLLRDLTREGRSL